MSKVRLWSIAACVAAAVSLAAATASAQMTFSIDFQGPTMGAPDAWWGIPITEGDILSPQVGGPPVGWPMPGPVWPPGITIGAGLPGPIGAGLGLLTYPQLVEVDALSFGLDTPCGYYHFSVDEFATGIPGMPPDVFSEGTAGTAEASADIFSGIGVVVHPSVIPPPPGMVTPGNVDVVDGDGMPPFGGNGLGLVEPNPPMPGFFPDPGDNLDALVMISGYPSDLISRVYFSLDSAFPDPLEGPPVNSGSAAANGFVGGDVLVSPLVPIAPPTVYAPAVVLGLDFLGPDTDDLDALVLLEDGDGVFNPGLDFLAFSVRRGSMVIGAPDSIWGAPIEEADILVPPVMGGVSPFPGILIPGEALGLATLRSGMVGQFGPDDLDALSIARLPGDCDGNGVVNVFDAIIIVNAFGSNPFSPNWDPRADLDCNNTVNVFDAISLVNNFGRTW